MMDSESPRRNNTPVEQQHHRAYLVPHQMVARMLTGDTVRAMNAPPRGAVLMSLHHDFQRDCFVAMYQHESFDAVPLGQMCPTVLLGFEAITPREG